MGQHVAHELSPVIAARYRPIRELGRGGMGVVYMVEHVHTGDHLALKLLLGQGALNAQLVERFKREARASARIKSEHVVKVVDADVAPELGGAPFLVMELLDGCDLEKLLHQRGRLGPVELVSLLFQAARALDKAHSLGIVHRDLKPENLFLHKREDGSTILKVVDFGISKFTDASGDIAGAGMTSTGAVMGTPLYMAPEQARGRIAEIGASTDVWALGLVALRLLTGEIYWNANTVAELMAQIIAEPMYPPRTRWPWLPAAFDAWFAKACARLPGERFASVGEQVAALAAVLGVHASAPAAGDRAARPSAPVVSRASVAPTLDVGARTTSGASALARSTASPPRPRRGWVLGAIWATAGVGAVIGVLMVVTSPSTTPAPASAPAGAAAAIPSAAEPPVRRDTPTATAVVAARPDAEAPTAAEASAVEPTASASAVASAHSAPGRTVVAPRGTATARVPAAVPPPPATRFSPTSL